ncbi:hypothetical protein [Sulfurimonas sp.]
MYKSKYCEVSYLPNRDAVLCKWFKKCSAEEYRNPLRFGLELLNKTEAKTWVTDTTYGFVNEPEDSQWLLKEFIPKTTATNCKRVVFIISNDSFLKNEIDQQCKALREYFEVLQIEKLEEM